MKKRKIGSRVFISIMAIMLIASAGMMTAGAYGNITDRPYSFSFNAPQTVITPEAGRKLDSTFVYMHCDYAGHVYTARAYATDVYFNLNDPNTNISGIPIYDVSHENTYQFGTGSTRWMLNWVYENNHPYAVVGADPVDVLGYGAWGVWSPDSV
jgi:hypothetical protein